MSWQLRLAVMENLYLALGYFPVQCAWMKMSQRSVDSAQSLNYNQPMPALIDRNVLSNYC
jgi:hypothetical protein